MGENIRYPFTTEKRTAPINQFDPYSVSSTAVKTIFVIVFAKVGTPMGSIAAESD